MKGTRELRLEGAVRLILALDEFPEGSSETVHLTPMSREQLREALQEVSDDPVMERWRESIAESAIAEEDKFSFTCPKCECHFFGTNSGGNWDDHSKWVVHCKECNWSGPHEEHVGQ